MTLPLPDVYLDFVNHVYYVKGRYYGLRSLVEPASESDNAVTVDVDGLLISNVAGVYATAEFYGPLIEALSELYFADRLLMIQRWTVQDFYEQPESGESPEQIFDLILHDGTDIHQLFTLFSRPYTHIPVEDASPPYYPGQYTTTDASIIGGDDGSYTIASNVVADPDGTTLRLAIQIDADTLYVAYDGDAIASTDRGPPQAGIGGPYNDRFWMPCVSGSAERHLQFFGAYSIAPEDAPEDLEAFTEPGFVPDAPPRRRSVAVRSVIGLPLPPPYAPIDIDWSILIDFRSRTYTANATPYIEADVVQSKDSDPIVFDANGLQSSEADDSQADFQSAMFTNVGTQMAAGAVLVIRFTFNAAPSLARDVSGGGGYTTYISELYGAAPALGGGYFALTLMRDGTDFAFRIYTDVDTFDYVFDGSSGTHQMALWFEEDESGGVFNVAFDGEAAQAFSLSADAAHAWGPNSAGGSNWAPNTEIGGHFDCSTGLIALASIPVGVTTADIEAWSNPDYDPADA